MMAGSPSHEAQLQQLQQHVLSGELHHQYQTGLAQPPPSTSSSPWQTLSELTELPADEMVDDGPHPVVMTTTTPFQQLVGSFAGEVDDDAVVSLDEPALHRDKPSVHQTRSAAAAHLQLFTSQRLNASA